jgi:hypothetical protein
MPVVCPKKKINAHKLAAPTHHSFCCRVPPFVEVFPMFAFCRSFRRLLLSANVLVLTSVATTVSYAQTTSQPGEEIRARQAGEFVDSMGVNIHMEYLNTPYGNYDLINNELVALGMHHVRDEINEVKDKNFVSELQQMYTRGYKVCGLIEGGNDYPPIGTALDPPKVAAMIKEFLPSIDAVEGPNEPDDQTTPPFTYGIDDLYFPWGAINESESLWQIVKGTPEISDLPVLGMSEGTPSDFLQLAAVTPPPIDYATYGNMHAYQGGLWGDWGLKDMYIPYAQDLTGSKPLWTTEMGYHNNTYFLNDGEQQGVSERAAAIYLPIAFLSGFGENVVRTFSYELIDEEKKTPLPKCKSKTNPRCSGEGYYGLLSYEGNAKPAFTTLQNLIQILQDSGTGLQPGSLQISFNSAPPKMRYVLLEKSNGNYYLAIWNDELVYERATWKTKQGKDVYPPNEAMTVSFPAESGLTFTVYAPNDASGVNPTGEYTLGTSANSIQINLPPKVLLIQIAEND